MKILNNNLFIRQRNKTVASADFGHKANYLTNPINSAKLTSVFKSEIKGCTQDVVSFSGNLNNKTADNEDDPKKHKTLLNELKKLGLDPLIIQATQKLNAKQLQALLALKQCGMKNDGIACALVNDYDEKIIGKVLQLKQAEVEDVYTGYFARMEDEDYQKILKIKRAGIKDSYVDRYLWMDDEQINKAIRLKNCGVHEHYISKLAKLSEKEISSVERLKAMQIPDPLIRDLIHYCQDENNFEKIATLTEYSVDKSRYEEFLDLNDTDFKKALELKQAGFWESEIFNLILSGNADKVIDFVKAGFLLDPDDAISIFTAQEKEDKFNHLTSCGHSGKISAVMTNMEIIYSCDDKKIAQIANLLQVLGVEDLKSGRLSNTISDFLGKNPDLDIQDFSNYINTINFEEISKLVAKKQEYTPLERLSFADYHYKNGTKTFDKNTLDFTIATKNADLTNYLAHNYLSIDDLTSLFSAFPLTSKKVGTIPQEWFSNIDKDKQKEVEDEIYDTILEFQKTNNINDFSTKLKELLKKELSVTYLDKGTFGTGYRISIDGADDVCLKIFDINTFGTEKHGKHIEVQAGLFANQHSNDFVKMHFGKLSPTDDNDGFLVTQYLSPDIEPIENPNILNDYFVFSEDAHSGHNMINGKIIDFGAMNLARKPIW